MNSDLSNQVAYTIGRDALTVSYGGQMAKVKKNSIPFSKAIDAIRRKDMAELLMIAIPSAGIADFSHLELHIHKGRLHRFGEEVPLSLADQIMQLRDDGLPFDSLLHFWDRLKDNPEQSSIDQLYTFLEQHTVPLTPEGCILAYKAVRRTSNGRLVAFHNGKVEYKIGEPTSMPRDKVVCSPKKACGPGLHVGSFAYAKSFGGPNAVMLEVVIDPKDVVSVPTDCAHSKVRCCRLFTSSICNAPTPEVLYKTPKKVKAAIKKVDKAEGRKLQDVPLVKIGRYGYFTEQVDPSDVGLYPGSKKLVPSDFPKFFKDLRVRQVYRIRHGVYSNYIAENHGTCVLYVKVGTKQDMKGIAKPKKVEPVIKKRADQVRIGHYIYSVDVMTAERSAVESEDSGLKKLTKSDWPLFFKRLTTVESLWRERLGKFSHYLVRNADGTFAKYTTS